MTTAPAFPASAATATGGSSSTAEGVTLLAIAGRLTPYALFAVTDNVYEVPFVRPTTVAVFVPDNPLTTWSHRSWQKRWRDILRADDR